MKAQGLPLNTIVLGALAVLVLVLLAAAFVPGIGGFFQNIFAVSRTDFAAQCNTYCMNADYRYSSQGGLNSSQFCTATDDENNHCYAVMNCVVHSTDGKVTTITNAGCGDIQWS